MNDSSMIGIHKRLALSYRWLFFPFARPVYA